MHELLLSLGKKPRKGKIKICEICNIEYYVRPYKITTSKYCSNSCRIKALNKEKTHSIRNCLFCSKEYSTYYSQIKHHGSNFCSNECKYKYMSLFKRGEKSPGWRGGVSDLNHKLRNSKEWKDWRKAVFERDNYTCQIYGERGGRLEPHHLKQFAYYPKLRFVVSNGQTLCYKCHQLTKHNAKRFNTLQKDC